jgi:hypothetical protein
MARVYPGTRYDADSLEGYVNASLLVSALEQIEGEVTHEKLMQKVIDVSRQDYLGLNLRYNPKTLTLSQDIWLNIKAGKPWIKLDKQDLNHKLLRDHTLRQSLIGVK